MSGCCHAGDNEIQVSVRVIVPPGQIAIADPDEVLLREILEEGSRLILVDLQDPFAGSGQPGERDVQVPISVVIPPGRSAQVDIVQCGANIREGSRVIPIDGRDGATAVIWPGKSGHQKIGIPVGIVVPPLRGPRPQARQHLARWDEGLRGGSHGEAQGQGHYPNRQQRAPSCHYEPSVISCCHPGFFPGPQLRQIRVIPSDFSLLNLTLCGARVKAFQCECGP